MNAQTQNSTSWAVALLCLGLLAHRAPAAEVGQAAPEFELVGVSGAVHTLAACRGRVVVLEWINPECPFVRKHYDSGNLPRLQQDLTAKGVLWFAVASSAKGRQGYYSAAAWGPKRDRMKFAGTDILLDPEGTAGRAFGAKATPHLAVVTAAGVLAYAGAIDDKPTVDPASVPIARNYVVEAVDAILAGKPVAVPRTTAYGCSVKY